MLSEILGFLDNLDVGKKSGKFRVNLNKNRIRSISAYSSNSIFYFPMIVSDQLTPEEATMIMRMSERMNASFVIACINLMPFHRIKADDKASIEEYLSQFHQNLGFDKDISGSAMQKFLGWTDSLQESYNPDELKQVQDFLMECWEKSKRDNMDFVKLVSESVSLHDMYDIDPIDPKTRIMQEQYFKTMEELDTWGFIGEATDDMFDDWTEEDLEDDEDYEDLDDEDWDEDDIDPDDYPEDAIDELLGESFFGFKKKEKSQTKPAQKELPDDETVKQIADEAVKMLKAAGSSLFRPKIESTKKFGIVIEVSNKSSDWVAEHEKELKAYAKTLKPLANKYDVITDIHVGDADEGCVYIEFEPGSHGVSVLGEAAMKAKKRNSLPDDAFGLPSQRKFPLNDKKHVRLAIQMFKHCPEKDRKELAGNIKKAAKKFGMEIASNGTAADYLDENFVKKALYANGKFWSKTPFAKAGVAIGKKAVARNLKEDGTVDDDEAIDTPITEGSVGEAISSIKFALESVSENKILSCKNLTKLKTLENKLFKLKNRYVKYLNRYKKKYNENKKKGTKSKLSIRFNNMTISDPKAFMLKFGEYIKIINKRLKLVEKRRAQLHSQKGDVVMTKDWKDDKKVNETTELGDLGQMDFEAVDYCITAADQQLTAPDSQVFELVDEEDEETLDEASIPRHGVEYDYGFKDAQNRYIGQARDASRKADRMADRLNAAEQRNRRYEQLTKQARQQAADERKRAVDAEKAGAQAQRENERLQKQLADQQKTRAQQRNERNANQPSGFTFDRSRPQSDINPYLAADAKHTEFHTFDRQVFTDMDMKKANDAIPTFAKATIGFVIDDTEEVISRDVLVGIKSYIHRAPSRELIDDVYNCIINKRKFLKFVKFITGEERSLSDLLFGIRELRSDALDGKKGAGQWRSAFKRRRRWAKMSIPYLMKEYTPNGTVVMTMNEVDFIKSEYGIDVMSPDHVKMIMDADFLLAFVIMDQANETVHVVYDGQGQNFQTYTYAQLEREGQTTDRMMRELYRSFSR